MVTQTSLTSKYAFKTAGMNAHAAATAIAPKKQAITSSGFGRNVQLIPM